MATNNVWLLAGLIKVGRRKPLPLGRGYDGLEAMGYTHRKTVIATSNDPAHNAIPAQILPFSPTIPSNKRSDEMP